MAADWIGKAIRHPGALTNKATKAGETPMQFAKAHDSDAGTTGKQARLAEELQGFHHDAVHHALLNGMKK